MDAKPRFLPRARAGAIAVAAAALTIVSAAAQPLAGADLERTVREVHAAAKPLDAHADILVPTTPGIYRTSDGVSQVTVEKLVQGGMATITLALHSPNGPDTPAGVDAARRELDAKLARIRELEREHAAAIAVVRSAAQVESAHAGGRVAVLIGFQNAYGLGTDLSLIDRYVDEGVRVFAFNHAGNNAFADSSRPSVSDD